MTRITVLAALLVGGLAGCKPSTPSTSSATTSSTHPRTDVDVHAPGVDVKVKKDNPENKAKVDVNVTRPSAR